MTTGGFTTCLWFDGQAEEAAHYYVSIFKNSSVDRVGRNVEGERARPAPCWPWSSRPTARSSSR